MKRISWQRWGITAGFYVFWWLRTVGWVVFNGLNGMNVVTVVASVGELLLLLVPWLVIVAGFARRQRPWVISSVALLVLTLLSNEQVSVYDFGIDNRTAADGLAVGRPSGFVGRSMQRLIDGYYTVPDEQLYRQLAQLEAIEGHRLEPSALAGLPGFLRVTGERQGYRQRLGLSAQRLANATHLVWGTGGSMVPDDEMQAYLAQGRTLLAGH